MTGQALTALLKDYAAAVCLCDCVTVCLCVCVCPLCGRIRRAGADGDAEHTILRCFLCYKSVFRRRRRHYFTIVFLWVGVGVGVSLCWCAHIYRALRSRPVLGVSEASPPFRDRAGADGAAQGLMLLNSIN